LILDADALNILSADNELLSKLPAHSILTPHPKEFERLFGKCDNDFARIDKALKKAKQLNCFIILKGHNSFIASPDGTGYFNSTGNAGMAKGGSGDILTGMLTGLSAQEYSILETCIFGTYLHGLAGDIAAENFSQEAMIAQDIIESIASAFKLL
jgi:NAD(P)H-hydrate epimerase